MKSNTSLNVYTFSITLLFVGFIVPNESFAESLRITLQLNTKSGNQPIAKTLITIQDIGKAGNTNSNGQIEFDFPKKGYYTIKASLPDKIQSFTKEISYDKQKIILYASLEETGEINVQGEKDKNKTSRYSLSQEDILRIPGAGGDSLKSIQTLPGITIGVPQGIIPSFFNNSVLGNVSGNPYSNSERGDYTFRGSGTRSNQFYFDGFPLPYLFHLGNQSSVLNNNIIQSFEVNTGAYSSRFGYATGGIVNIQGIDRVDQTKSVLNVNFFQSDAFLQTRLLPGFAMITGVRKNYPNLFYLRAYPQGIPEDAKYADYHDYQAKFLWDLDANNRIQFQSFGSADKTAYTKNVANLERGEEADRRPPVGSNRDFRTDGARYIVKGNSWRTSISHSYTRYLDMFEANFQNPLTAETIFGLNNNTLDSIRFTDLKFEKEILEKMLDIEVGVQSRDRSINLYTTNLRSSNRTFLDFFDSLIDSNASFRSLIDGDKVAYKDSSAYSELRFKTQNLKITPGIRVDRYNKTNEINAQPRLNIQYTIDSTQTTLLAGSGIHYNSPTNVGQLSSISGNPFLTNERSEHNALGFQQPLGSSWKIQTEIFKNIYSQIITPDSEAKDPYSPNTSTRQALRTPDEFIRNPIANRNLNYSNSGYGTSEGLEIFLKKERDPTKSEGFYGWLSYTNSITNRINNQPRISDEERSRRTIENNARTLLYQTRQDTHLINYYNDNQIEILYNNDKMERYDLDRTHILNLVFGYKWQNSWQVGGRFRYFTGNPYTPIVSSRRLSQAATSGLNLNLPEYSSFYNSERYPDYHQLDIRIDRFLPYEWGYVNVYLDIINVYGRRNAVGNFFNVQNPYQSNSNPSFTYDFINSPYIQTVRPGGSPYYLPYISMGMEVRF